MNAAGQLTVSGLWKRYDRPILTDLALEVAPGETVAIVGPSGSGKSTLLHIIGSLEAPDAGSVCLGDCMVTALTGAALAAYRASAVGFVFQDHHLLPQLTVLENVLLPTLLARSEESGATARALLARLGIVERASEFPARISGGERQRAAVARALINRPRLLLCDEPTGNLDADSGAAMIALLLETARVQGVTVLMVTHNLAHAARFDRGLVLRDGRLAPAEGMP